MAVDISQYVPENLRDLPLFTEIVIPALEEVLNDIESGRMDSVAKYTDFEELPAELLERVVEELGYDYISDVLALDKSQLVQLVGTLAVIHSLKGHKTGLLFVMDLLGFEGSSVTEWWEQDPEGTPHTFDMEVNLNTATISDDEIPRLLIFIRQYVYPLLDELTFISEGAEASSISAGIGNSSHHATAATTLNPDFGSAFYQESLHESVNTTTSYVDKVSMTETFTNGQDYIVFVTWMGRTNNASAIMMEQQVLDDGVIKESVNHRVYDTGEYLSFGSFFRITGDGTSRTINLRNRSSVAGNESAIREARIMVFPTSSHQYAEVASFETEETTTSGVFQDYLTLSFTPSSTQNYLFLASLDATGDNTDLQINIDLEVEGTQRCLSRFTVDAVDAYRNIPIAWVEQLSSGATRTINLRYVSDGSNTVKVKNGTLIAIPFDSLTDSNVVTNTIQGSTTSATYEDGMSMEWKPAHWKNNEVYYWLSFAKTLTDSGVKHVYSLNLDGYASDFPVITHRDVFNDGYLPAVASHMRTAHGNTRTDKIRYTGKEDAFSTTKYIDDQMLIAFRLL